MAICLLLHLLLRSMEKFIIFSSVIQMFGIFNSLADVNVWYRWDAPKLSENDFSNRKCLTGFGNFLNICWPYGIVQQFLSDLAAAESFIIHTVSIFIQQSDYLKDYLISLPTNWVFFVSQLTPRVRSRN